ncbi:MAG TPA: hypothetical protein VFO60_05010 [Candidatus Dormibacteraeota bacterium]|nr:hypothetical protein [Candidatus Dormibacteraeota bacterium]
MTRARQAAWPTRRSERAQAIVETALVLPVLLLLALGFAGAILVLDAEEEIRSATGLATTSAFSAPAGDSSDALRNVQDTFQRSVRSPVVDPGSLRIDCPASQGNQYLYSSTFQPNTVVSCHGAGTITFHNSVLGLVWRWDIQVGQDAQQPAPNYRQCAAGVRC